MRSERLVGQVGRLWRFGRGYVATINESINDNGRYRAAGAATDLN